MNSNKKFIKSGESVYFYRHKTSLIDWHQWGPEAMEKAKDENKLLFISIGYVACSWCVNTTHMYFEYNEEIARFINENFVPILVDRDERPDLDRYYSNMIQATNHDANWPISCFTLYDGTPVFATTYLTSDQLMEVAENVLDSFKADPFSVLEIAKELKDNFSPMIIKPKDQDCSFSERDIHIIVEPWKRKFDKKYGGTLYPPKYPLTAGKEFLLEYAYFYKDIDVINHLNLTLKKMAEGGIYDQVNGGFFHYAIDVAWRLPHFEKQLIDSAVLVSLYAKAYQFKPSLLYKKVIEESVQFCMRNMLAINGGFYSSIQADPLGREGIFYTWTIDELEKLLGENAKIAIKYYGLKRRGASSNGRNILRITSTLSELSETFSLSEEELNIKLVAIRQKLIEAFNDRAQLNTDDKVITSVNAIVTKAFLAAYQILGYEEYLLFASETLSCIKTSLMADDGALYRYARYGKAEGDGFLDDYAYSIDAFISMYFIDGEEQWLLTAKQLLEYTLKNFFDPQIKMFLYSKRVEEYSKTQTMPVADGGMPSAGSVMVHCIAKLALFFKEENYSAIVTQMMSNIKEQLPGSGPYCANWARFLFYYVKPYSIVAIVGSDAEQVAAKYTSCYHPDVDIIPLSKESKLPLFKDVSYDSDVTMFYFYAKGEFQKKTSNYSDLESRLNIH